MNWERKLDGLSFLSLKNKEGESNRYVKLSDVKTIMSPPKEFWFIPM